MWQIYNAFLANGYNAQQGPLPCKRWVKRSDDKPHKLSYKWKPHRLTGEDWTHDQERKAKEYARWIAARDSVPLEGGKVHICWSGVYPQGSKRWVRRIRAVEWGHEEEVYNTRKDGKRGAYLYKRFVAETSVELPNWDWVPAEPVETFGADVDDLARWNPTKLEALQKVAASV